MRTSHLCQTEKLPLNKNLKTITNSWSDGEVKSSSEKVTTINNRPDKRRNFDMTWQLYIKMEFIQKQEFFAFYKKSRVQKCQSKRPK